MAHLAGIDKGPILDWTNDNGLMECYQKWRKKVEVLFKDPLNTANDQVKCNYVILLVWRNLKGGSGKVVNQRNQGSMMEMGITYTGILNCLKST